MGTICEMYHQLSVEAIKWHGIRRTDVTSVTRKRSDFDMPLTLLHLLVPITSTF